MKLNKLVETKKIALHHVTFSGKNVLTGKGEGIDLKVVSVYSRCLQNVFSFNNMFK